MPIYRYICGGCNKHFERIISLKDAEAGHPDCEDCYSNKDVKRVITTFGSYTINGDNSASVRPKGVAGRKVPS